LIAFSCFAREEPYKEMSLEELKEHKKGPKLDNLKIEDPRKI